MSFINTLFYSFPDASKIALDQAQNYDRSFRTVTPHSYKGLDLDAFALAGTITNRYINLSDFDFATNPENRGALYYGDLLITYTVIDIPAANNGLMIEISGYQSNGELVTPYGQIIHYTSKNSPIYQIDRPQAFVWQFSGVWTYGVSCQITADATGYLAGQFGVTFNGLRFSR